MDSFIFVSLHSSLRLSIFVLGGSPYRETTYYNNISFYFLLLKEDVFFNAIQHLT